ncbi:MAG: hypothetical protein H6592_10340 [Flavobacteriales bacterium]|nr:hypothetical protein [Flavobacteriales bacterium]
MRPTITALALLFFCSCSNTPEPGEQTTDPTALELQGPPSWTGYYSGTIADEEVSLWVRPDSIFILQRKLIGQDSVPDGTFGRWHPRGNELQLSTGKIEIGAYQVGDDGALTPGSGEGSSGGPVLERLADAIGDAVPRMRVSGTYVLADDAQSFKPCGSTYEWPCVGGMDLGEEGGEAVNGFSNEDLLRNYRKAVRMDGDPWEVEVICTLGMGPAMEGEGADEYLFIGSVLGDAGSCP